MNHQLSFLFFDLFFLELNSLILLLVMSLCICIFHSNKGFNLSIMFLKVTVNGTPYHKICFKCTHGGCTISPSSYIAHEGKLYCKHHHIQLFKEKGNYSQLETTADHQNVNSFTEQITTVEIAAES